MTLELVHGIYSIYRIPNRREDFALRNVGLHTFGGLLSEKRARANLDDFSLTSRIAEVIGVPLDTFVVEVVEEVRVLGASGHVHRVPQHIVKPGRAGPRRANSDNVGEPRWAWD